MNALKFLIVPALLGMGLALGGAGGGRVAASPQVVPYVCEDGSRIEATYASGGDHRHAKVSLSFEGRTAELSAAPTLYGRRYLGAPGAAEPRALMWSLRGEHAALAEATAPADVADAGRPIARCTRYRGSVVTAAAAHSPEAH